MAGRFPSPASPSDRRPRAHDARAGPGGAGSKESRLTPEDVRRQVQAWYGIELTSRRAAAITASLAALRLAMAGLPADDPTASSGLAQPGDFVAALVEGEGMSRS